MISFAFGLIIESSGPVSIVSKEPSINTVSWLEVSIEGCRIWPLVGKIGQKKSEFGIRTEN